MKKVRQKQIKLVRTKKTSKMTRKQVVAACEHIHDLCREYNNYISANTKLTNQLKAIARSFLDKKLNEKVSDKELKDLIGKADFESREAFGAFFSLGPLETARQTIVERRKEVEKRMILAVRELPIWTEWAHKIGGIAEKTMAQIIGGSVANGKSPFAEFEKTYITIGDYGNPAKLWKRWGVAVINGERQRRVKATDAERKKWAKTGVAVGGMKKAIEHGYSAQRRAILYVLGDGFVKNGVYYRQRYDEEKAYQLEKYPTLVDSKGKKRPGKGRAHNRAMRKSTKLFLRDVWNKWRELHGGGEYHKMSGDRD
jgi:hypothetical protein